MNKVLAALALAIALPTLAAASDINPGALQLSGKSAFDFNSQTVDDGTDEIDQTTLGGGLSAMYYVSKFLAFGLATEYQKTTTSVNGVDGDPSSKFLFGPKAGIDYELVEHLSIFADLTVGAAQFEENDEKGTGFGWEIGAGVKLFLNRNVSLDLMGTFNRIDVDMPTAGKVSDMGYGVGIGISVYLTNNPVNAEGYVPPAPVPAPYR